MHLDSVRERRGVQPRWPHARVGQLTMAPSGCGMSATKRQLGDPLTGHTAVGDSLDFSPDGTKLLSASDDHTLRLWPVPARSPDAARDALCAKLTHNMSREQWNKWVSPEIDYIKACPGLPEADYAG